MRAREGRRFFLLGRALCEPAYLAQLPVEATELVVEISLVRLLGTLLGALLGALEVCLLESVEDIRGCSFVVEQGADWGVFECNPFSKASNSLH